MARRAQIEFYRDPKDNIRVTVSVDTGNNLTEEEIKNDPMLCLLYRCLEPVFPYVHQDKQEKKIDE